MTNARITVMVLALLLAGFLVGCGGDKSAKESVEAAAEAVQEAGEKATEAASGAVEAVADMTPDELKAKVNELTESIMSKEKELEDLKAKIQGLAPADLASDAGKKLKEQGENLGTEIDGLKEKLQAYTDKMMGGE